MFYSIQYSGVLTAMKAVEPSRAESVLDAAYQQCESITKVLRYIKIDQH